MSTNKYFVKKNSFELSSFPFKGCSQPLKQLFYLLHCFSLFLIAIHEKTSAVKLKCTLGCHIFSATKNFWLLPFTSGDIAYDNKLFRKALSPIDLAKKG